MRATGLAGAPATVRSDKTDRDAHAGTTAARRPGIQRAASIWRHYASDRRKIQESITTAGRMDSGPARQVRASRNDGL